MRLEELNQMPREDFAAACGGIFEHSPWVAARAWDRRPFASIAALHKAMVAAVTASTASEQLALINAHPDLVGRLAREGRLTRESTSEQRAAGLDQLTADEIQAFEHFNEQYRKTFGFPFIICARENRKDTILATFPARLQHTRDEEVAVALAEIAKIARLRLNDLIVED